MRRILRVPLRRFFTDLSNEIKQDNVSNGAAALAYYLLLSIFPATIFLLSILPFLPIPNLDQTIMDFLKEVLPGTAANVFQGTIEEITLVKKEGLLSFGALFTLWAASNGMYAIMQQLNITYDVVEGRPFWKTRGIALLLTVLFTLLIVGSFALVIFGGTLELWIASLIGENPAILYGFTAIRWVIIITGLLLGFALTYYYGPDVEQEFRFVSPGSVLGGVLLISTSLGFKYYVDHFGKYDATYGSLGAVIVMMLWLYITGLVILIGSEVNALIEHYSPDGKLKGQKEIAA